MKKLLILSFICHALTGGAIFMQTRVNDYFDARFKEDVSEYREVMYQIHEIQHYLRGDNGARK